MRKRWEEAAAGCLLATGRMHLPVQTVEIPSTPKSGTSQAGSLWPTLYSALRDQSAWDLAGDRHLQSRNLPSRPHRKHRQGISKQGFDHCTIQRWFLLLSQWRLSTTNTTTTNRMGRMIRCSDFFY
jgi:hypothetical protein